VGYQNASFWVSLPVSLGHLQNENIPRFDGLSGKKRFLATAEQAKGSLDSLRIDAAA
jgi:hypothetical protein